MTAHTLFDREENQAIKKEMRACAPGLGICSVPMQEWEQIYDEDTAFSAGTIFPCLNKPFLGGGR